MNAFNHPVYGNLHSTTPKGNETPDEDEDESVHHSYLNASHALSISNVPNPSMNVQV